MKLRVCFLALCLALPAAAKAPLQEYSRHVPSDCQLLVAGRGSQSAPQILATLREHRKRLVSSVTLAEGMSLRLPTPIEVDIFLTKGLDGVWVDGIAQAVAPGGFFAWLEDSQWVAGLEVRDAGSASSLLDQVKAAGFWGAGPMGACRSNLTNLSTALEMYSADHQGAMPADLRALTPNYLARIPVCPVAGSDTYSAAYEHSEIAYSVACSGDHHGRGVNRPLLTRDGERLPADGDERVNLLALQDGIFSIPGGWAWCQAHGHLLLGSSKAALMRVLACWDGKSASLASQPWFGAVAEGVGETSVAAVSTWNDAGKWPWTVAALGGDPAQGPTRLYLRPTARLAPLLAPPSPDTLTAQYIPARLGSCVTADASRFQAALQLAHEAPGLDAALLRDFDGRFSWASEIDPEWGAEVGRHLAWSEAEQCGQAQGELVQALNKYRAAHKRYPDRLSELHLKPMPICPAAGRLEYRLTSGGFRLDCRGRHHEKAGLAANEPHADRSGVFLSRPGGQHRQLWVARVRDVEAVRKRMQGLEFRLIKDAGVDLLLVAQGPRAQELLDEAISVRQHPQLAAASEPLYRGATGSTTILVETFDLRSLFRAFSEVRAAWMGFATLKPEDRSSWSDLLGLVEAITYGPYLEAYGEESWRGASSLSVFRDGFLWKRDGGIPSPVLASVAADWKLLPEAALRKLASPADDLAACEGNLRNLRTRLEIYAVEHHNRYPKDLRALDHLPVCPCGGTYVYRLAGHKYELSCEGKRHGTAHPRLFSAIFQD